MSADRLAEIRARADAATEGPWAWASRTTADGDEWAVFDPTDHALASNRDGWAPDAEFIAHARTDVPWLLAEVERLREGSSRVERNLDDLDRAEADRDIWRDRWQQLMRDHEEAVLERNSAETHADRAEATLARVREALSGWNTDHGDNALWHEIDTALKGDS